MSYPQKNQLLSILHLFMQPTKILSVYAWISWCASNINILNIVYVALGSNLKSTNHILYV